MADDPRPGGYPENPPPARQAGIGKRRLLIKAALIGSTMPVVVTIGHSASAAIVNPCKSLTTSVKRSRHECGY
jgi:hypothetical protein